MTRPQNLALTLAGLCAAPVAVAGWGDINLPVGVTDQSREIFSLHMIIFWVCVVLSVGVYSVLAYSLYQFRKSRGAEPATFQHNSQLEWTWTILAAVILIVMAIPSTITLARIYTEETGDVNIKVVGYQWKWEYEYLDDGFSFFSNLMTPEAEYRNREAKGEYYLLDVDEPVYVPVGKSIRFLITANDVLHSFWVRDLGIKQDAIPGYFNTALVTIDEPGVYRGVCAELCGRLHGFMPIVVVAVSPQEYDAWRHQKLEEAAARKLLYDKEWTAEELASRGQDLYGTHCAVCHQANGLGLPGAFPQLAQSEMVLRDLEANVQTVAFGVSGTAMQAFGKQLDPVDLAAVITYTRRAWGNDTAGDGRYPTPSQLAELLSEEN